MLFCWNDKLLIRVQPGIHRREKISLLYYIKQNTNLSVSSPKGTNFHYNSVVSSIRPTKVLSLSSSKATSEYLYLVHAGQCVVLTQFCFAVADLRKRFILVHAKLYRLICLHLTASFAWAFRLHCARRLGIFGVKRVFLLLGWKKFLHQQERNAADIDILVLLHKIIGFFLNMHKANFELSKITYFTPHSLAFLRPEGWTNGRAK